MGRIVAQAAHELNNVIAIVEQNAGLLQDLTAEGATPPPEKLRHIADQIGTQSRRGTAILRAPRTFAHSADSDHTTFDVGDALANLCLLARRSADLKGVGLRVEPADLGTTLLGSPFRFQQSGGGDGVGCFHSERWVNTHRGCKRYRTLCFKTCR